MLRPRVAVTSTNRIEPEELRPTRTSASPIHACYQICTSSVDVVVRNELRAGNSLLALNRQVHLGSRTGIGAYFLQDIKDV